MRRTGDTHPFNTQELPLNSQRTERIRRSRHRHKRDDWPDEQAERGGRHANERAERAAASFRCVHCRTDVSTSAPGTLHRNHCPFCLWSRHVDDEPGDRAADCGASMEPIAMTVRGDGEWVLIHRCSGCGVLHANRIAGDDNPLLLLRVAVRPLALPPFPLDRLASI
jgi:hypothetical protein